ncbi:MULTISPECIES: glycosyltransferase [Fischerella]|uniref:Family 2 glycosyl transferase n=1 Tax=Fischerella muscicola CCMEE 5323 TaxID=2019572 RepID=A0A2N6JWC1_FISMU|nr:MULTISPECIES: glycosyltransferase [Fischerella]MBD2430955.1 glycosyltransferase [Fischerella sp. FACHB-380]PLZ84269.1 family 2 glycosyl transferase [Fischerella muscicola CCMEE 5323]
MSNEPNPYRPRILPLATNLTRPLWSVMIPTYNSGNYLRETLASVLAQDPGGEVMQITVIDNCSTKDDPAKIIAELGGDRIELHRQPTNVGMVNNFQKCIELARGHLVHILHADDCVRPGFYEQLGRAFHEHPKIGAAFCRTIFTNEFGQWIKITDLEQPESGILPSEWLEKLADICRISPPAMVVRREVYEQLGGFDSRCGLCIDWEMWVRIFVNYPIWFEVEPLATWRIHLGSSTSTNVADGHYAKSLYQAILSIESCLGDRVPKKIYDNAKQNCAFFALRTARNLLKKGDTTRAIAQIKAALTYSQSFRVVRSASRLFLLNSTLLLLRKTTPDT